MDHAPQRLLSLSLSSPVLRQGSPKQRTNRSYQPRVRILQQHLVDGLLNKVSSPGAPSTLHALIDLVIGVGTDTLFTHLYTLQYISVSLSLLISDTLSHQADYSTTHLPSHGPMHLIKGSGHDLALQHPKVFAVAHGPEPFVYLHRCLCSLVSHAAFDHLQKGLFGVFAIFRML